MSGLLIKGQYFDVPGVEVISPNQVPWARMNPQDYRVRTGAYIQMITVHTTQGVYPHKVIPGAGPGGADRNTANYWSTNNQAGGAPLIVDTDGSIVCLIDLVKFEAYHATKVNPVSVGIEMVQLPDGTIYQATLNTTVTLVRRLCDLLGIPMQTSSTPYKTNAIIERLRYGGIDDVIGVFGHRDNAWMFPEWLPPEKRKVYPEGYADRGRGDPGDDIYALLHQSGAMMFDFNKREDLAFWKPVQAALNVKGAKLVVDGICGPRTVAALKDHGLWNGGVFLEPPII